MKFDCLTFTPVTSQAAIFIRVLSWVYQPKTDQEIGLFAMDINALAEETTIRDDRGIPDLAAME